MPFVETEWWAVEIPDEWSAVFEDDCVSIVDCDAVGSLEFSAVRKERGPVEAQDLRAFAQELTDAGQAPESVTLPAAGGLYFEFEEEGIAWREWYLSQGSLFLYVTYCTDAENAGLDRVVVDQILTTLVILNELDSAQNASD